jgi:hypothetical protein
MLELNDNDLIYLGDSVHLQMDRKHNRLWIFTFNGTDVTNPICLEPEVAEALREYLNSLSLTPNSGTH